MEVDQVTGDSRMPFQQCVGVTKCWKWWKEKFLIVWMYILSVVTLKRILLGLAALVLFLLCLGGLLTYFLVPVNPYRFVGNSEWSRGIVIDMGSSGSRVSLYQWATHLQIPVQPSPLGKYSYWQKTTQPGVSGYGANVAEAANSLNILLDYAQEKLKEEEAQLEDCPVFIYGTGGLRMLSLTRQKLLLQEIRQNVREYPFQFRNEWVAAIPIKREAIYDWLTIQQTLTIQEAYGDHMDEFDSVTDGSSQINGYTSGTTIGVIDIGGASIEIAFEPEAIYRESTNNVSNTTKFEDESNGISSVYHSGISYQVYSRGFELVGHNQFLILYQKYLYENYFYQQQYNGIVLRDPCGLMENVVAAGFNGTFENPVYLYGSANAVECLDVIRLLFNVTKECDETVNYCSFDGLVQPPVRGKLFIGVGPFRTVRDYFDLGDTPVLSELLETAIRVLEMDPKALFDTYKPIPMADFYVRHFELFYIYIMLTEGFGFSPQSNQILFNDRFYYHHTAVTWTLGAITSQVDQLGL